MHTRHTDAPLARVDRPGATAAGLRPPEGASGMWRLMAGGEVAGAAVAVLVDWLIPSLVLVGFAVLSLLVRRRGPGSLGFHRPTHPWRLVGAMAAFAAAW